MPSLRFRGPSVFLVWTFFSLAGAGSVTLAQEPQPGEKNSSTVPETGKQENAPSVSISPTAVSTDDRSQIVDDEASGQGALKTLDTSFATVVGWMEKVLFYRIGAVEKKYVVYAPRQYYVRDRGSDGPFIHYGPIDTSKTESLSTGDVELLAAQGKLVTAADDRDYRLGRIGKRPVEYVTVKKDDADKGLVFDAKYILSAEDDTYHRSIPPRDLLSSEETLSRDEVAALATKGALRTSDDASDAGRRSYELVEDDGGAPVVVLWLSFGAVFFTLYMRGVNLWGFRHAIEVVRGKYDNPAETGEVTHFQALASALSATVGLGNIAGVTIAMAVGGPGAFFWMILCGLFGMTSKFVECTLGQKYRAVKPDGTILGGPMRYLQVGIEQLGWGSSGKTFSYVLSISFAVMCILASFGGGNMFQANQSGGAVLAQWQHADLIRLNEYATDIKKAAAADDTERLESLQLQRSELDQQVKSFQVTFRVLYGLVLAAMVAVVIIGGIRRIGAAAEKLVPSMCLLYLCACSWIILVHITEVPSLIALIFGDAFSGKAMGGGMIGVLVVGVRRAAFSNEAGVGSAAIAHSAARTEEPIREGMVAMLGPFIDTVVVCSMTALVILITGAWDRHDWVVEQGLSGAALTSQAFRSEVSWFPWILSLAVVLFAYSTIISWSYYGERCCEMLFGPRSIVVYKALAVLCVFVGAVVHAGAVLDFSDMMILSMAFPNILGVVLLAPRVRRDLIDYWRRHRNDEFETFK